MLCSSCYEAGGKTDSWFCFPQREPLVQTQWLLKLEILPAPLISHLCFSLLQLEKPPEKEEDHAPEFIKVRENLRRITTLTSEEKVL